MRLSELRDEDGLVERAQGPAEYLKNRSRTSRHERLITLSATRLPPPLGGKDRFGVKHGTKNGSSREVLKSMKNYNVVHCSGSPQYGLRPFSLE